MVQIVGKYQFASSENFENFMKNLGRTEIAEAFLQSSPIIDIQQNGDQWIITVNSKGKTGSATFKFGETYEEHLLSLPTTFKSIATKEGENIKIETVLTGDLTTTRVYEFTADEMIVHVSCNKNDVKAKRIYKRL